MTVTKAFTDCVLGPADGLNTLFCVFELMQHTVYFPRKLISVVLRPFLPCFDVIPQFPRIFPVFSPQKTPFVCLYQLSGLFLQFKCLIDMLHLIKTVLLQSVGKRGQKNKKSNTEKRRG